MDKLGRVHKEGGSYYGHGQALCFDCTSQGYIVESVNHGYDNDALTSAEVSWLIQEAESHARENHHYNITIYTFAREV